MRQADEQGVASATRNAQVVRAVLVDGDGQRRRAVRAALEAADVSVMAGARSGAEGLRLVERLRPDVVVVALGLPDRDGVETIRALVAAEPRCRIVALPDFQEQVVLVDALRAGAVGVARALEPAALARAVRSVAAGEAVVPAELTLAVLAALRRTSAPTGMRPVRSNLTPREWEVLDLLCAGDSTSSMAAQLGLSTETIRSHVKAILRKLGVSSRAQAVASARRLREDALTAA